MLRPLARDVLASNTKEALRMRVLTVAAHPDDETLGAGGTMAWHAARGDTVWALILADGASSRHGRVEQQADCARSACEILGVERLVMTGLPDQRLDTLGLLEVITPIEQAIDELRPDVVLTHFMGDVNEDHRLVARATMVATRPVPGTPVRRVCAFEIPSSTDWAPPIPGSIFAPNLYVDISQTLDIKLTAMKAYAETYVSEVRPYPHPRSLEALTAYAQRHGATSGLHAAEAFVVLRESATAGMSGPLPGSDGR
jgi:LmbE family N-acetylglucosaminyl deacetylase